MPKKDKYAHIRNVDYVPWKDMNGIQKAITLAGSQRALAQHLGVSQQAVSEWEKRGYAPDARIVEIEAEYGIDRIELVNPALRRLLERKIE